MVKKDLVKRVAALLRENGVGKPVVFPRQVLHVTDDFGRRKDFMMKRAEKDAEFTVRDVESILDAYMYAIQEALRSGDSVTVKGFGTFGLSYRKPSVVKNVLDGQEIPVEGRYLPKFVCGNDLRRCAQVYEQTLIDRRINEPLPVFDDEED